MSYAGAQGRGQSEHKLLRQHDTTRAMRCRYQPIPVDALVRNVVCEIENDDLAVGKRLLVGIKLLGIHIERHRDRRACEPVRSQEVLRMVLMS